MSDKMASTGNPIVDADVRGSGGQTTRKLVTPRPSRPASQVASRLFPDREAPGIEGLARKAHYGDGKQPIDHIVEAGWGPEFCAGNVLKYLRRDKDPEHSRQSARWYYDLLGKLAAKGEAKYVLGQLRSMLSSDEIRRLERT